VSVSPWFQTAAASLKSKTNFLYSNTSLENIDMLLAFFNNIVGFSEFSDEKLAEVTDLVLGM